MKLKMIKNALLVLVALVLAGCGDYGDVKQGRVVAFDANAKTVTFIEDSGTDDRNPDYKVLPPATFKMPELAAETGPLPQAGLRMRIDLAAKEITMYDPNEVKFVKVPIIRVVDEKKNVDVNKQHPLVFDADTGKPREFPQVDMGKNELKMYSHRLQELITVQIDGYYLNYFAPKDWNAGDEVRIYYKNDKPDQILRFMNVSKTDIYKR